jgi:glycosyltransferase involved in cell wall biosynthesis
MKKLSIIVPVYNVEQYIRPCVESVFSQKLDREDYELILVNDGTQDNSFGVIADIIEGRSNVKVVEQANQGLSAARNTGLAEATGEYVLFLDSDDLLLADTLNRLLRLAEKNSADMVVAGFIKMTNEEIAQGLPLNNGASHNAEVMHGNEGFLNVLDPHECYVWRTIYGKAFLDKHSLRFVTGIYFEDVPFTVECYLKAKTCVVTSMPFYIYRQRPSSIVSAINTRKVSDFNQVLKHLWQFRGLKLTRDEQQKLMNVVFVTFSIEFWYIIAYKHLYADRKVIIGDLKRQVPDLFFDGSWKRRTISFMYRHIPFTYLAARRGVDSLIRSIKRT